MIKALSSLLVITLAAPTHEQTGEPVSPCPDVFTYDPLGSKPGRWFGIINVAGVDTVDRLNIVLDSKAELFGRNWIGLVYTTDNMDFQLGNADKKIPTGLFKAVQFYVLYNTMNKPPKVQAIILNGVEVCKSNDVPPAVDRPTGESEPIKVYNIKPDLFEPPRVPSISESNINIRNDQNECGKVVLNHQNTNLLVVNGRPTLEGQWPWQVAIYRTETVVANMFKCGGTLVTLQHVVTAAHCVTHTGSDSIHNKYSFSVYLGKHDLGSSTEGVQIKLLSSITVHPEYNASAHSKDLSVLKLREPVVITDWVRPACLWPDDKVDLSNVIGKTGSVVGWGYDSTGFLTRQLNLVEMPVVDQETCIRSRSQFFSKYTSQFTLCAGAKNGQSVCNGDSGGGMVFNMQDTWFLRALVSLSIAKTNENVCDPTHYVVFTDLAKFLPWIKDQIGFK